MYVYIVRTQLIEQWKHSVGTALDEVVVVHATIYAVLESRVCIKSVSVYLIKSDGEGWTRKFSGFVSSTAARIVVSPSGPGKIVRVCVSYRIVDVDDAGGVSRVSRHFGPRTLRHQDTSAPVPKCLKTDRHPCRSVRDISAPVLKCLETLRQTLRHRVMQLVPMYVQL